MSLDYDKLVQKQDTGSEWTSYSDLFMVLAFIFLLLYVTASLRTGTNAIEMNEQIIRLTKEVDKLKEQQVVYENLKQEYMSSYAQKSERQKYDDLMKHLDLLEDEANEKQKDLERQASEQNEKRKALNHYQKMIKNIIDAQVIQKSQIAQRDRKIQEKNVTLTAKQKTIEEKQQQILENLDVIEKNNQQIASLEKNVEEKRQDIERNKQRIEAIQKRMKAKISQLNEDYKNQKIAKQQAENEIRQLQIKSEQQIKDLESQNNLANNRLNRINNQLEMANEKISKAHEVIQKKDQEKRQLAAAYEMEKAEMSEQFESEKSQMLDQYQKEKNQLVQKYQDEKDTLAQQLQKDTDEIKKKYKKKQKLLKQKLAEANKDFEKKQKKLAEKLDTAKKDFTRKITSLEKDLGKAQERENARKQLASKIKENFKDAGIEMDVDQNTGDVMLTFGDAYFETGKHDLKDKMQQILKKFIPIYAKSLFEDPNIGNRIEDVEIVGYASPTFKGQQVDPKSLSDENRGAVNYNLDLSYKRAKSIFNYVFYDKKLNYQNQKKLLGLVKVSGAGYFSGENDEKNNDAVQCKEKDCKDLQRVIIKFNLDNR